MFLAMNLELRRYNGILSVHLGVHTKCRDARWCRVGFLIEKGICRFCSYPVFGLRRDFLSLDSSIFVPGMIVSCDGSLKFPVLSLSLGFFDF